MSLRSRLDAIDRRLTRPPAPPERSAAHRLRWLLFRVAADYPHNRETHPFVCRLWAARNALIPPVTDALERYASAVLAQLQAASSDWPEVLVRMVWGPDGDEPGHGLPEDLRERRAPIEE